MYMYMHLAHYKYSYIRLCCSQDVFFVVCYDNTTDVTNYTISITV